MKLLYQLLSLQDPTQTHTWLTRALVSGIILFANIVLYGFFGVMGAVVVYLIGVEGFGMARGWMLLPVVAALAIGLWRSVPMLVGYWRNHGHGDSRQAMVGPPTTGGDEHPPARLPNRRASDRPAGE